VRLEHQVELTRFGERAGLAATRAGVRIVELVEAEPVLAVGAIDQWIGEVGEVTAGLPDLRRAEDGGVDQHDVVAHLHHRADPCLANVAEQQGTQRAVVVRTAEAAVDLGRGVDETPSLAQIDNLVDVGRRHTPARLRAVAMLPRTT
jgi:hypothetical protein